MLVLLLTLTALFGLLTWRDARLGLLALVATLPSYLLRTDILGVPTTLLELFVLVFLGIWAFRHRSNLRALLPEKQLLYPLLLLLTAALISTAIAPDTLGAIGVLKAYYLEPIALFLVFRYELGRSTVEASDLFKALGASALVLSLVAIVQFLTGAGIPIPWDIERRVTSVFAYPNALGLFLGPIVIISFLSKRRSKRFTHQWWLWVSVATLSTIAIALAQSEAALVAIVATLSIAGLLHKGSRPWTTGIVGLLVLATLLSPWRTTIIDKLTLQDYSGGVRLSQWSETVNLLQDRWLLGAGLSGYQQAIEPYHEATHLEIFQYPHNILLNIWVELGLLGVIAIAWLIWVILGVSAHPKRLTSATIATWALIEMLIHGLVDVPFFKNDLAVLTWLLLAIALYVRTQTPQKISTKND